MEQEAIDKLWRETVTPFGQTEFARTYKRKWQALAVIQKLIDEFKPAECPGFIDRRSGVIVWQLPEGEWKLAYTMKRKRRWIVRFSKKEKE